MEDKLYTAEEVAERYRVKESTVWRWARNGYIPVVNLGAPSRQGPYRFRTADLEAFEEARLTRFGGAAG